MFYVQRHLDAPVLEANLRGVAVGERDGDVLGKFLLDILGKLRFGIRRRGLVRSPRFLVYPPTEFRQRKRATIEVSNGLAIFTGGTLGATQFELSNGRAEVGAGVTASSSGVWKLRSGILEMLETSDGAEPDIYVGRGARVMSERDLGNVWNMGTVLLNKLAEIEAAHVFHNLAGGMLDHRSNGDIPILEAYPGSLYTMQNAHRIGSITTLNEWDGSEVILRGPAGAITPGTHNFIGKPPLGASGSGTGISMGGGS